MKLFSAVLFWVFCLLSLAGPLKADQWGSVVISHCYDLDDRQYQQHFFVRVFWTEVGGGQFYREKAIADGPRHVSAIEDNPESCVIDGVLVRFELLDYVAAPRPGRCGLCEQTGFRLTADGVTIWETPSPDVRGTPIFNGTLDVDRDMARICAEQTPEELGVQLPYEPDFFSSKTSMLVCETISR
ncbi:hypothetical protein [Roseobacter sp. CCS2]|uniref:hypothetical protein n=1 Tax=Roseobacter sp. CCS2 TaxID=391593 RepID=UPI0000F3F5C0|nr:hypothetical protein [Roseobacter sp. CCS2]EBA10796.1 hypothetical protein RCCS2_11337 [Roseobacter sp. CCS2]